MDCRQSKNSGPCTSAIFPIYTLLLLYILFFSLLNPARQYCFMWSWFPILPIYPLLYLSIALNSSLSCELPCGSIFLTEEYFFSISFSSDTLLMKSIFLPAKKSLYFTFFLEGCFHWIKNFKLLVIFFWHLRYLIVFWFLLRN